MQQHIKSFISGFLATMLFHQGLLQLLNMAGTVKIAAWNFSPVPPLGIPSVISLAFWGGLWGIALWLLIRKQRGTKRWASGIVLGALLPSLVALFIVFPMKGMALAGDFDPKIIVGALLLNGAWGLGVLVFMRLLGAK